MTLRSRDRAGDRILVVDDDGMFRESLVQNLSDAGFSPIAFADGASALRHLAEAGPPELMLLDWKMPGMTGIEVLRQLRQLKVDMPVVFLTVLSDQIYEEAGLLGGAVDFIEKSRSFSIISRRIDVILNGYKGNSAAKNGHQPPSDLTHGPLRLRRDVNRAFWKAEQVELTLNEFQIVNHLVTHAGQDVVYREIYDLIHGERFVAGNGEFGFRVNVRAFIKRIRQKFRDIDPEFAQIENYPGFGYRWRDTDAA
jgi:two-component system response regulator ChvI